MAVRKYLLLPQILLATARAPRDQRVAWGALLGRHPAHRPYRRVVPHVLGLDHAA